LETLPWLKSTIGHTNHFLGFSTFILELNMNSRSIFVSFFLFAALLVVVSGCKKEGIGGSSTIAAHVKHHESIIPFAKVYIKYGAKEFPGTTLTAYDDSLQTDAEAHGHFEDLVKGDYYLYGIGYDSAISSVVTGGIAVKLPNKEELEVDVPVTE
jgi:hypothetical protein